MSVVHFQCYRCGQRIVMGDKFFREKVKCNECGTVLIVPASEDAISLPAPTPKGWKMRDDGAGSRREGSPINITGFIAIACGILAVAGMLVWFCFLRDTWERDHGEKLTALITEADQQFAEGQIPDAIAQYEKVIAQIGDHKITDAELVQAVSHARARTANFRAEEAETKHLAEVARQQELAQQEEARQRMAALSWTPSASTGTERYYRDSHGELLSEADTESKMGDIRRKINSMPDTAERAYMQGEMQAVENEWSRIKRQGPVKP